MANHDYIVEYDADGRAARMWWVAPEDRICSTCGEPSPDRPEHEECYRGRAGYYFKGRNPDCRWCGGRGCLQCGRAAP